MAVGAYLRGVGVVAIGRLPQRDGENGEFRGRQRWFSVILTPVHEHQAQHTTVIATERDAENESLRSIAPLFQSPISQRV